MSLHSMILGNKPLDPHDSARNCNRKSSFLNMEGGASSKKKTMDDGLARWNECNICFEPLSGSTTDKHTPILCTCCGQAICRTCIAGMQLRGRGRACLSCPICQAPNGFPTEGTLVPARALCNAIQATSCSSAPSNKMSSSLFRRELRDKEIELTVVRSNLEDMEKEMKSKDTTIRSCLHRIYLLTKRVQMSKKKNLDLQAKVVLLEASLARLTAKNEAKRKKFRGGFLYNKV